MSQQEQQQGDDEHPVISDLCFHLSKCKVTSTPSAAGTAPGTDDGNDGAGDDQLPQPPRSSSSIPLPVAAIRVLLNVIRRSKAETMMGLQAELRDASDVMVNFAKLGGPITTTTNTNMNAATTTTTTRYVLAGRSYIALSSGCELFLKFITRASLDTPHFQQCKVQVLDRGTRFAELALMARSRISTIGCSFINDGCTILTHGRSSVVESLLVRAAQLEKKRFNVIVLEGRPDAGGIKAAKSFVKAGIPTTVVLDSAMGYIMERVDMVLVGAEGVVENGGIVNKVGTYALGVLAKELGVPLYVAVESYKFTRLYPLNNADLPDMGAGSSSSGCSGSKESGKMGIGGAKLRFLDTLAWSANSTTATPASPSVAAAVSEKKGEEDETKKVGNETAATITTSEDLHPYIINLPSSVTILNPPVDFTPAKFITLLFTDLGVLTPSAVSDELIRLTA
ncbi:hypothetical protein ACHAXH_006448 [Discostella pseudostelligera]